MTSNQSFDRFAPALRRLSPSSRTECLELHPSVARNSRRLWNVVGKMTSETTMYGAEWCSDGRRSKNLLDTMGIDYEYIDLEVNVPAADIARAISGRTNIPVITFPDGTHFVEPTDAELRAKVESLAHT